MAYRLDRFEGAFDGETCFIVGSGPSINETPLAQIGERYKTFGMNRICKRFKPSFLWVATGYVSILEYYLDIADGIEDSIASFACAHLVPWLGRNENLTYVECLDCDAKRPEPGSLGVKYWTEMPVAMGALSVYGSSAFAVTRLAVFMGFRRLVLVGFDLGYKAVEHEGQPDPNHFDPDYETGAFTRPQAYVDIENRRIVNSHEIIAEGAKALGVEILNATIGGECEAYPRVDVSEFLKG